MTSKHRGSDLETSDLPVRQIPTREGYDRWAEVYDEEVNPLVALDEVVVPSRLGDLAGSDVLDLGCGTGRWCCYAARRGASVVGVDFAANMLARAQSKLAATGVQLVQADLTRSLPLADHCFDLVISGLVLEHIAAPKALFEEARRVCQRSGRLFFSTMHPALFDFGKQAHFVDRAAKVELRFHSYPHQVADFIHFAEAAGLNVKAVEEYRAPPALAAQHPALLKYGDTPLLLTVSLQPS